MPQAHQSSIQSSTSTDSAESDNFLNRESSWLEFNRRVLHEAQDERTPLLERVRFLSIFSSNLDEFIMKRVGGLRRQHEAGVVSPVPDELTPAQNLKSIRTILRPLLQEQASVYAQEILPALAKEGIHLLKWADLTPEDRKKATTYFQENVFPVLTPLAVDPGHPFPFLSNLSTSMAVSLQLPDGDENLFARVKVPNSLPRWFRLDKEEDEKQSSTTYRYMSLLDVIRHNLQQLFTDMVVVNVLPFRITRNADVERDEEDVEDLMEMIEDEVRQRRFEKVVRLEHGTNPDPWLLEFLTEELKLSKDDLYEMPEELDYTNLNPIASLNLPRLRFKPWTPVVPPQLTDSQADLFSIIRKGDLLVHHPYESFRSSVERFIQVAADDPKVLAIKMTVYRTSTDSPFIHTLIRAAESGKQVVCAVELKARFDEERNIHWAHVLEKAGVHAVFGTIGLKTHCKIALVVRQEAHGLQCYVHIGTGNYHSVTANLYTDFGLFTAKKEFTEDVVELFHYLTGRSLKKAYHKLLVAPVNMREQFEQLIQHEIDLQKSGKKGHIIAKLNSLEDRKLCNMLYDASKVGVKVQLIVRGFCCLKPGVPGLSENITVISVIGRFLEHSRIFYFGNGSEDPAAGLIFMGSADWMYRNLNNRVEAITPIEALPMRQRIFEMLTVMLKDQRQAWDMNADGSYTQRQPEPGSQTDEALGTHETMMQLTKTRNEKQTRGPR